MTGRCRKPPRYPTSIWASGVAAAGRRGGFFRPHYFRLDLIKLLPKYSAMQSLIALADPNRRRIVEMLAAGELAAGEIGTAFDISAPAI